MDLIQAHILKLHHTVLKHIPHPANRCAPTEPPTDKPCLQHIHDLTNTTP